MPPNYYEYAALPTSNQINITIFFTRIVDNISQNYGSRFVKSVKSGREKKELKRCRLIVPMHATSRAVNQQTPQLTMSPIPTHATNKSSTEGINIFKIWAMVRIFIDWRTDQLFSLVPPQKPRPTVVLDQFHPEILIHGGIYILYTHGRNICTL